VNGVGQARQRGGTSIVHTSPRRTSITTASAGTTGTCGTVGASRGRQAGVLASLPLDLLHVERAGDAAPLTIDQGLAQGLQSSLASLSSARFAARCNT